MTTNSDKLIMQSVMGAITHPVVRVADTRIDNNGNAFAYPNVGGICYNYTLGSSVYDIVGDHIEPDVSIKGSVDTEDKALNFLSCIGNVATVVSGQALGAKGIVIGKHGGIEHVLVHFGDVIKQQLTIGDKIQIVSYGQGLAIDNIDVAVKNIDPSLLYKLADVVAQRIVINVAGIVPSYLMGSGVGYISSNSGDYDIMTADFQKIIDNKLDNLCIGDIVAITDSDTRYGRGYRQHYITIGIVVHSNCCCLGHGPGVVTIMSGHSRYFDIAIDKYSNILNYIY